MRSKANAGTQRVLKYFCAQDEFTEYNGASLCIHVRRQFYASHVYNVGQEYAKYGNIFVRHRMESYSKRNHILYYLCNLYFHFSFFLFCHSWCLDPNTLLLHLGIDKIATEYLCSSQAMSTNRQRRKKKHNLSQSEFSRSLHANAKGKCSPCTCCPWLPNITKYSTSRLAIKQNFQWCFCLESYFASPAHLSLALKQLTQVLILRANEVCQNKALISIIFLKPGDDNLFDIVDVLVVQLLEDFNLLDGPW